MLSRSKKHKQLYRRHGLNGEPRSTEIPQKSFTTAFFTLKKIPSSMLSLGIVSTKSLHNAIANA